MCVYFHVIIAFHHVNNSSLIVSVALIETSLPFFEQVCALAHLGSFFN